jgi:hypothetical protein
LPLVKRRFSISCREEECSKLYEIVKDKLPALSHIEFVFTNKGLLIEVYGYESDVKTAWFEIKRTLKALKEAMTPRSDMRKYSVDLITRITRRTFSPELLVEVIKRMGRRAVYVREENSIFSDMPLEEVTKVAESIAEKNAQLAKTCKNTSTRYFLVACTVISGLPVEDVVRISQEIRLLGQDEGKYIVKSDWKRAVDEFYKCYKQIK